MMHAIEQFLSRHPVKGFLADDEANALYNFAKIYSALGPCLELGSYCGLSTVYLGNACRENNSTLFALDHHRGSEEHQRGEEYHDPELYDATIDKMDSFREFRQTLHAADLEDCVVPLVCSSDTALRSWATPLALVFIDGGHSEAMATRDCIGWSRHIADGGILLIHDIFEKPEDGGQGPWLAMNAVLKNGEFIFVEKINSLGVLKKQKATGRSK